MLTRSLIVSMSALLGSALTAQAVTLTTPLMQGGSAVMCAVTNAGTHPAFLASVTMLNARGEVMVVNDYCGSVLAPLETCEVVVTGTSPYAVCQVTGSGKLRVAILAYEGTTATAALAGTAK